MDFREAVQRLGARVTQEEVARRLGLSYYTIRQAVQPPGTAGHRNAPAGWRQAVIELAREREAAFGRLADELEQEEA